MRETLFTSILFFAAVQYLVLGVFAISRRKGKTVSHRLLAAFLLGKALTLVDWLLYRFFDVITAWNPHVFVVGETFIFTLPPLLYLYTLSLLYGDFRLRARHLLHSLPFLLAHVFLAFRFYAQSAEVKIRLLSSAAVVRGAEAIVRSIAVDLQFIVYIVMALVLIARYQRALMQSQSSVEKSSASWLRTLLVGYAVINLPFLFKHFIYLLTGTFDETLILVHLVGNLAFVTALVFKGLHHSELFNGLEPGVKYGRSLLPEAQRETLLARLRDVMERERPFLEPGLTLQALASRLDVTPHQLSQLLNDGLGQSFYDYINGYRVRESQRRLAAVSETGKTVLEVLHETGFSSKSTFNAAFKKHTGMTPTEFRNSCG